MLSMLPPVESRPVSLLLDVDGTLLDFAPHPDAVLVTRPLISLLQELHKLLGGALALVSGRSIASLNRLFQPFVPTAVGLHGLELRTIRAGAAENAESIVRLDSEPVPLALAQAVALVQARFEGSFVENKGWALAVHHCLDVYRAELLAAQLQLICARYSPNWIVLRGRQVFEVKSATITKATAVERLMGLAGFAGTVPVAMGDDVTDLDMFGSVRRHGGLAVSVGPRIAGTGDVHLASPASSLAFLQRMAQHLRDGCDSAELFSLLRPASLQHVG